MNNSWSAPEGSRQWSAVDFVNRGGLNGVVDELYDLEKDPYEIRNVIGSRAYAGVRDKLRRELAKLVAQSVGL
jgi:hypothetical protein